MIVTAHQPAYLPWLGLLHKAALSDVFVLVDNVQFEKDSFINRNKLRSPEGWRWLTVPASRSGVGKVSLSIQGRFKELHAVTDGETLAKNSAVTVVDFSGSQLVVEAMKIEEV